MATSEQPLWRRISRRVRDELKQALPVVDSDVALSASMAAGIEFAATRYALSPGAQWRLGEPLKLLFAGYSGTRNTGADVRVEEMVKQVRHLLGDELCDLSITTIEPELSKGYFKTVKQLTLPQIFPRFVVDAVHEHHGVITCEGSMFKSKFANALSTFMVGSLGVAAAENKLAIAYGGEAGKMDKSLEQLVSRYCKDALIMCRNTESREVLGALGVPTKAGTDTAWTFEAAPASVGEAILRSHGWDGKKPVLVVCPINAFWWPVKPDVLKGLAYATTGAFEEAHYKSVYFHHSGQEVRAKQERYIKEWAKGIARFEAENDVFTVAVGMEKLDRSACEALSAQLGGRPVVVSDNTNMFEMVSLLRCASMLMSSRYHAIVCSMPGGVPSAGITMDERIANLMADRKTPELALKVDQSDLADAVYRTLKLLHSDGERVRAGIADCVEENLVRMGQMGMDFVDYLVSRHPELPLRSGLGAGGDPWAHLPPLSSHVQRLLKR